MAWPCHCPYLIRHHRQQNVQSIPNSVARHLVMCNYAVSIVAVLRFRIKPLFSPKFRVVHLPFSVCCLSNVHWSHGIGWRQFHRGILRPCIDVHSALEYIPIRVAFEIPFFVSGIERIYSNRSYSNRFTANYTIPFGNLFSIGFAIIPIENTSQYHPISSLPIHEFSHMNS